MKREFYPLNASFQRLGQLDAFTKFELVTGYNVVKGWYVEMDAASDQAALMQQAEYISAVLAETGDTIWTGALRRMKYDSVSNTFTFYGVDALWLKNRRALPVPSGPPYTSAEYDVRTGPAETVIKNYVKYNAGSSAKTDRQIPGLTLEADAARGITYTGRARFDKLTDLICGIGLATDLGLRVLDGEFQIWVPQDLSAKVRFSDITDTLGSYEFEIGDTEANYLYGGGSGSGTSQAFYEKGDPTSITEYGRVEGYVNIGRTAVTAEIDAALDAELQKQAATAWFKFTVVETPDRALWTDYWLGDLVSVEVKGQIYVTRLCELTITVNADRTTDLKPIFIYNGSFVPALRMHDSLVLIGQRIARLEEK
jgi:hypothetical protein